MMQVGHCLRYQRDRILPSVGRPITLDRIALDFPELKLIGIHLGYPWTEEMISVAWKHENVYIGSDAYAPRHWPQPFVHYLNTWGQDKVLFGTDWPVIDPERAISEIEELEVRPGSKKKLLRENALRLFRLPESNSASNQASENRLGIAGPRKEGAMLLKKDGTALIVVDMQNAFCHLDGSIARIGHNIEMLQAAIAGCQRLVETARVREVPIVFTRYVYRPDYRDGGLLVQELMPELAKAGSLKAGTWDAEVVDELMPQPGDFVIDKNRYSAFYSTGLEPVLTSLGINSLVICGVTTNMCVETTARDAMQRDYRTFIVRDATGELARERHEFALATLGFGFGRVVNVDDVTLAWTKKPIEIS